MSKKVKESPLEKGLGMMMKAIDNQVAREMQRSPSERDEAGVRKWGPHSKRIERLAAELVGGLGEEKFQLDALLVLSQASAKALQIFVEELGEEGLGEVRSDYCQVALEAIGECSRRGLVEFEDNEELFN